MRRFRIVGAELTLEAADLHGACKVTDRLQGLLDSVGVELRFERIEGINADVVPLQRPPASARDGGHP